MVTEKFVFCISSLLPFSLLWFLQEAHVSTLESHLAVLQKEQGEVMTKATEVEYQEGAAKARNAELSEANA